MEAAFGSCDHRRACFGISGDGFTFSCPDCLPQIAYVGHGKTPGAARADFVEHAGEVLVHPAQWRFVPPVSPGAA